MTKAERKERNRRLLVGIGVVWMLFSGPVIVWQQYHNNQLTAHFHAQTLKKDAEIASALHDHSGTLKKLTNLQNGDHSVISNIPEFEMALATGQDKISTQYDSINQKLAAICVAVHASCGP